MPYLQAFPTSAFIFRNFITPYKLGYLSEMDASANWDQGKMSLEELLALIKCCFEKQTIAGVDICGENAKKEGNWEASEVEKNNKTNLILLETIGQWMKEQEVNR